MGTWILTGVCVGLLIYGHERACRPAMIVGAIGFLIVLLFGNF